jgi:AI-2 transport protein TqsA
MSAPPGPTASPRPPVLPRGLLILLGTAAATVTIAGLKSVASLAGPVFLALILTIAIHPVRGWLRRVGLPSWAATFSVIVVVYVLLVGLTLSLVVAAARFATLLPRYQEQLRSLVDDAVVWLDGVGVGSEQVDVLTRALDPGQLVGFVGLLLGGTLEVLTSLFFIVTLLLFLALDAAWFPGRLSAASDLRGSIVAALGSFAHGTRRYLVVSTVFGLIVAVIDTGLLYVLGIPVPLLWGLLAFITNYIPNIGFVVGLVPPAILGLLEGGLGGLLAVLVGYSVVNVVIQSFIQPKFVGDAVGLSTSMTFLSLVFWGWVFGALGALLAIPLSLLAKALFVDVDPGSAWLRPLLSGEHAAGERDAVPARRRSVPSLSLALARRRPPRPRSRPGG